MHSVLMLLLLAHLNQSIDKRPIGHSTHTNQREAVSIPSPQRASDVKVNVSVACLYARMRACVLASVCLCLCAQAIDVTNVTYT